jgi:hypothetical protein
VEPDFAFGGICGEIRSCVANAYCHIRLHCVQQRDWLGVPVRVSTLPDKQQRAATKNDSPHDTAVSTLLCAWIYDAAKPVVRASGQAQGTD